MRRERRASDEPASDGELEGAVEEEISVRLSSVTRSFGDVVAVAGVSLSLRSGEFFSLLGPSGCGKTTTLRMIAGFESPDSGSIEILGRDVVDLPPNKRPVNTVFQNYALFAHLNVYDNVAFGLRESRKPRKEIAVAVSEALALVRLSGYEARKPRQLSGGEQQRVSLARAIVNAPALLLLDEPLGALDLKLRRAMQTELKAIQQRLGMTFLYVTHDQEEALTMSDRVAVMERGRVAQVGTPQEIYDRPTSRYVADFVGETNMLQATVARAAGPDGVLELELSGGRRVRAPGGGLLPGQSVTLLVRPEKIDLTPAGGESGALVGVVEAAVFVGSHRRFVVSVDGVEVIATSPNRRLATGEIGIGDRVELDWKYEDVWVTAAASDGGV